MMTVHTSTSFDQEFIEVTNDQGFQVIFCTWGASVYTIKKHDVYLNEAPLNPEDFLVSKTYFGKTLGRVSGRIKNGTYVINGKVYELDKNEGKNTLHGGVKNFSFVTWNYRVKKEENQTTVTFTYLSKDGECGFNGNCLTQVDYIVPAKEDSVEIIYHAVIDQPSILALSNHLYFNLGNEDKIYNHSLCFDEDKVAILDDQLIVKEYVKPSKILDFTEPKVIGKDIKDKSLHGPQLNGYDHRFLLKKSDYNKMKAVLKNQNYTLECYSTFDELVVYCDGFPTSFTMLNGKVDSEHHYVALEFVEHTPKLLGPNQSYIQKTKYVFKA